MGNDALDRRPKELMWVDEDNLTADLSQYLATYGETR